MKNYKLIACLGALFFVSQVVAMEMPHRVGPKPDVLNSKLSKKQQKELRDAIMGMRPILMKQHNGEKLSSADQKLLKKQESVVNKYTQHHADDSFVIEKMKNHRIFLRKLEKGQMSQSQLQQSQLVEIKLKPGEEMAECCICLDQKPTVRIPCENSHSERICQSCLDDIVQPSGSCPMCRAPLK